MKQIDRLEQIVRDQSAASDVKSVAWTPAFDLKETSEAFTVFADLPGVEEDEIHVSVRERSVVICGAREFDHDNEDAEEFVRIGRPYGSYSLQVPLPSGVYEDLVRAKYRKGVLRLRLPKRRHGVNESGEP